MSDFEQCLNWLQIDLILILLNFTIYDFLEARIMTLGLNRLQLMVNCMWPES